MKNTREPSNMQRLLREWTLARYTAALERGDLETLSLIMERATQDSLLQLMILEIHEVYQDHDLLSMIDDKDDDMEIKTGTANSTPEHEDLPEQSRKTRRRTTWMRALAAAALVFLLAGGFLGVQFWRASQTAGSGQHTTSTTLTRAHNGWCIVNSPQLNSNSTDPQLTAVSGDAPNDVWAIGSDGDATTWHSITEHWNGHAWSVVPLPQDAPGNVDQINAIKAIAPGDAWAVGFATLPQPSPSAGPSGNGTGSIQSDQQSNSHTPLAALSGGPANSRVLLEHWNGQQWSIIPLANSYPASWGISRLNAISATSASDIWVVGSFEDRTGYVRADPRLGPFKPLVEHWDGTKWSIISSSAFPQYGLFEAVTAVSPHDIWITSASSEVGDPALSGGTPDEGTLLHWNGTQWQSVPQPQQTTLTSFSAITANDIWAIGEVFIGNTSSNVIAHWDGTAWKTVHSPDASPAQAPDAGVSLSGITAISASDVWVAGSAFDTSAQTAYQVVEHWNGQQWQIFPQDHNDDPGQIQGITSVAGKIWAVGIIYVGLQQIQQPLIETNC